MDELPSGAGWGVAGLTLVVGLVREWVRGRDQTAVAREQGAAAVVPELLERLDAQDRRLDELRRSVDECEQHRAEDRDRLDEMRRAVDECARHRAEDAERMADAVARAAAAEESVRELQAIVMRTPVPPAPERVELGPIVSRPPPLPAHIRSVREEPSE